MHQFKLETHCHTTAVSACGHLSAQELVDQYLAAAYDGLVITDHLNFGSWSKFEHLSWTQKMDHFLSGYRQACEAAKGRIDILLGMELHFRENENDYLIFGLNEDLLYRAPADFRKMGLPAFRRFACENGLLIYQAHPFRAGMTIIDPQLLDGVEVYNSHPRHDSRNEIAELWAERFGLARISGSDCHQLEDVAGSGIASDKRLSDMPSLMHALRDQDYTLIGKPQPAAAR